MIAADNDRTALRVVESNGSEEARSFAELAARSNRAANLLELWEILLAAMKLGAVVIPASTLLGPADLVDRVERANARHVVAGGNEAAKF